MFIEDFLPLFKEDFLPVCKEVFLHVFKEYFLHVLLKEEMVKSSSPPDIPIRKFVHPAGGMLMNFRKEVGKHKYTQTQQHGHIYTRNRTHTQAMSEIWLAYWNNIQCTKSTKSNQMLLVSYPYLSDVAKL